MSQNNEPGQVAMLLTEAEAAKLLGFSRRTLQGWRSDGGPGLPFVRISKGCVRYRRSDIEAWIEDQLRTSTADDAARGTVLRRPRAKRDATTSPEELGAGAAGRRARRSGVSARPARQPRGKRKVP